jgi:hypothetical protein
MRVLHRWRFDEIEGVVPDQCPKDQSPPRRALLVTAGCGARGKAGGLPFHPGATGEGKTGRVNEREPLNDVS